MQEIVAILYNIRSLHNVGSVFRTSDGAGVKKIYLCGYTPAPADRLGGVPGDLAKTALGAEKYIAWEKDQSLTKIISKLRKQGYKIWAVEQDKNSINYARVKPGKNAKIALLLGPEVEGLGKKLLGQCDKILEIPMLGRKESLNVSVAYGIIAYHLAMGRTGLK